VKNFSNTSNEQVVLSGRDESYSEEVLEEGNLLNKGS